VKEQEKNNILREPVFWFSRKERKRKILRNKVAFDLYTLESFEYFVTFLIIEIFY